MTELYPESSNPDKYEKVFIPLTESEINKKKFEGEYDADIESLYNDPRFIGEQKAKEGSKKEKPVKTKAEVEKLAKDAGYTYEEYYQLVKDKITIK
jgi:hypothetical protein